MGFIELITSKNNVKMSKWPELPKAFSSSTMQDVIRRLKEEGWDVFDVHVGGQDIHMARLEIHEIYFDNNQAIMTYSDYGHYQGKIFYNLCIKGDYKTRNVPERYWCKIA